MFKPISIKWYSRSTPHPQITAPQQSAPFITFIDEAGWRSNVIGGRLALSNQWRNGILARWSRTAGTNHGKALAVMDFHMQMQMWRGNIKQKITKKLWGHIVCLLGHFLPPLVVFLSLNGHFLSFWSFGCHVSLLAQFICPCTQFVCLCHYLTYLCPFLSRFLSPCGHFV